MINTGTKGIRLAVITWCDLSYFIISGPGIPDADSEV